MPSTNESASQEPGRKKDRACDACRRRKIKCDGPLMLNHVCTNCIQTRKPCSYVEASRPRGPPKAYISNLEDRLEELEALLQQIHPGVDFSEELGPPVVRGSWKTQDGPSRASSSSIGRTPSLASNVLPPLLVPYHQAHSNDCTSQTPVCLPSLRSTHLTFRSRRRSKRDSDATLSSNSEESSEESPSSSSETEEILITSVGGREKITLRASENDDTTDDNNIRFHGRSSTAGLVETTRQFKHMHIRETMSPTQKNSPRTSPDNLTVAQWRRPEFWQRPSWEYSYEGGRAEPSETLQTFVEYFPPPDLADTLIGLYFGNSNLTFPLLHRPTFDRQWQQGLHHRNVWFAGVCMSMFAIASRWCDDERVLPEAPTAESPQGDWRRAGRHYFDIAVEIHLVRRSLFHQPSLFEVQTFALIGMYLRSTAAFPSAWTVISAGLRKAQDVGAHRKKVYRTEPNIDDELWKRVFWLLVILDRLGGASLGRACGIAEEERYSFDLDFPLEVDDEYLEANKNQHERFKQPPGVPSTMTAFVQLIKLTQIMAFAMRTLYAIDKSKIYHGFVPLEQQSITEQLSLAMSEWLERVPEHLRWHDKMDNPVFFHQSASLFTLYHLTQMLVYRPLIAMSPSPPTPTESNFINHADSAPLIPALADPAIIICTEAARSCARIVEAELRHGIRKFYIPSIINVSYICAGLFLVHAWNLKVQEKEFRKRGIPDIKPPLANRIEQGIMDAKIFLRALEEVKPRWDIVDMLL
ncbi:fungal-specific transcription factor domain-containing protein [Flammula alnicola]|nr:fungal-specific transcription factor domain-containing protein [Flammula alnicola]